MGSPRVRLEYLPTRNGGIRQRWVAESGFSSFHVRGGTAIAEYVGYGRTRVAAIRDLSLRPYSMDFDSVEWPVRYELGPAPCERLVCLACSSGLNADGSCYHCDALIAAGL